MCCITLFIYYILKVLLNLPKLVLVPQIRCQQLKESKI